MSATSVAASTSAAAASTSAAGADASATGASAAGASAALAALAASLAALAAATEALRSSLSWRGVGSAGGCSAPPRARVALSLACVRPQCAPSGTGAGRGSCAARSRR